LYKLSPELRWTAGGYVWPVDRAVECANDDLVGHGPHPLPSIMPEGHYRSPPVQGVFSTHNPVLELDPLNIQERNNLRWRVENSGAVLLEEAEIMEMPLDSSSLGAPITKERVPFVSGGQLEKLVVNVLLVVYIS
jgi:hypothetical protein